MTREIGIGVVGLGWMGRAHSSAYKRTRERFPDLSLRPRLVAAADPVLANREAAVAQFGFDRASESFEELLADPEIDAVSICSPNFLHRDFAVAAASAGKPFWIEKPMGTSVEQSREIHDAARAADVATAVGFNYRHVPAVDHIRALVLSGRLGRITNIRSWFIADYASSSEGPLTWRYDRERAGSGVIGDLLSHGADLVQHILSDRITGVTADSGIFIADRPIPTRMGVGHGGFEVGDERGDVGNEDWVAALGRTASGVRVTMESSRVARGHRSDYAVEVFGTEGSARWSFTRMNEFEVQIGDGGLEHGYTTVLASSGHGQYASFQPGPGIPMSFDDLKTIEAARFLSDIADGARTAPNSADGLSAAEVCQAVVDSASSRMWQEVPAVEGTTFGGPAGTP